MRNRLVHFLVLGGLVFLLAPRPRSAGEIAISRSDITQREQAEARKLGVTSLNRAESDAVVARAVEDELLFREGLRLGLDRDDHIVRQRIIEKVLLLAEDLGGASRPAGDDQLRAWFAANAGRFQRPPSLRLVHVFAAGAAGAASAAGVTGDGKQALNSLRPRLLAAPPSDEPPAAGDPFPWPRAVPMTPADVLAQRFGAEFATAVAGLPVGEWSEPIASRFGFHLVRVLSREAPRPALFEEVRARVRVEYLLERKQAATQAWLAQAARRYQVVVEGSEAPLRVAATRVAAGQERGE